jgi:nucleotide-binding universal stress UspA family protein
MSAAVESGWNKPGWNKPGWNKPGWSKPGWSKPSTILFASEIPANEKAFGFALAQAQEFGARLIVFHAYDTLVVSASETSGIIYYDHAAAAQVELTHLEPLAERVRKAGVECETVVRPGQPAEQILAFLKERESGHIGQEKGQEKGQEIDRIVMGTHSPGPIGKLLVGSVAEAVLRTAKVPVCIIGPEAADGRYRNFATRAILCGVSLHDSGRAVAAFAAELAAEQGARLILQHVIRPQHRHEAMAGRTIDQIEAELLALIPAELAGLVAAQAVVVPGDPTEELLYQGRAQQAELIVLGAQGASAFAAATRQGVVYKLLAHAHCPVITLSPVVLAACGGKPGNLPSAEVFLAGVF